MSFEEDVLSSEDGFNSDEDDRFDAGDFSNFNKSTKPSDDYAYEILTMDEVVKYMLSTIQETSAILGQPLTVTRILLSYFKWDKEKLLETFFNCDQKKLCAQAHLDYDYLVNSSDSIMILDSSEDCGICFTPMGNGDENYSLECGHCFCVGCWNQYLINKIKNEGKAESIQCAGHKCRVYMGDESVMTLLKDNEVKLTYQNLITKSFIECNRLLKNCAKPGCEYVVKVQYTAIKPITCKCGKIFCYQCSEDWHDPVKCDLMKQWQARYTGDEETLYWIKANTRNCPKCNTVIEKNKGCNIMTCTKDNCRTWFCWFCLKSFDPYAPHAYTCTNYGSKEVQDVLRTQKKAQNSLERFKVFSARFEAYKSSLKLESNLYDVVNSKMKELMEHNMSWIEVQFLKKAVDVLSQCRQMLMFTSVFAFYYEMEKNNQYVIFRHNKADLENAVEWLSLFLESDLKNENLDNVKAKVTDKLKYCEERREKLLAHVHEGYEKNWWIKMDDEN